MCLVRIFSHGVKIKNFDPEISDQNGIYYPQQKVISIGVDIKF